MAYQGEISLDMSPLLVSIHTSTYNHTTGGWRLICRPRELCHVAWRNVIAVDRSDNRGHRSYICIVLTCTRIRVRSFDSWTCILYYQDDDDDDMAKARLQVARTEIRVSVPPRMRHGGIPHGTAHRRDMSSRSRASKELTHYILDWPRSAWQASDGHLQGRPL